MDEATALLHQARADWRAAERFVADEEGTGRCHAIAKWQQTVEKAMKALMSTLYGAGILNTNFRTRHEVERYTRLLVRLPRGSGNKSIQQLLHGILDQNTREAIRALDRLTPGLPARRNTEYPFPNIQGGWTYPAAKGVFSQIEVRQFRELAHRVLSGVEKVVTAIQRRP